MEGASPSAPMERMFLTVKDRHLQTQCMEHRFGGEWTEKKLEHLAHYLRAYTTILSKKKHLSSVYIDAFAGTGYRSERIADSEDLLGFSEDDTAGLFDGSARIALKNSPPFDYYVFIEQNVSRVRQLEALRTEFPTKEVIIRQTDANAYLQDLCHKTNWHKWRALVFLDPYGMQADWQTIELLAKTKAVDLWYLFPIGIAVNRLLTRSGEISPAWKARLNKVFGTDAWFERFYSRLSMTDMFGDEPGMQKIATFPLIADFLQERLNSVFAGVASNPRILRTREGRPLFLLCFATANPNAVGPALKIAEHILKMGEIG